MYLLIFVSCLKWWFSLKSEAKLARKKIILLRLTFCRKIRKSSCFIHNYLQSDVFLFTYNSYVNEINFFYEGHIFFTDFFCKSNRSRKILISSVRIMIQTSKFVRIYLDASVSMSLVAFCQEIGASDTLEPFWLKLFAEIHKTCKNRKFSNSTNSCEGVGMR